MEKKYIKFNSFVNFKQSKKNINKKNTEERIVNIYKKDSFLYKLTEYKKKIIKEAISDLSYDTNEILPKFQLTKNVIAEIDNLKDEDVLNYIFHRYRYEIFPQKKIQDDYPPYLQIEPSSICNFRCVFCFETDTNFTNKKNGFMGKMKVELFKKIIDDARGKIEFISLASRGEPFVNDKIEEMLKYTNGKFLGLKINTNASLLNEKKCHSILSGGVSTIVFSADAADSELYKKLRVNGSLEKVFKNIEMFNKVKEKHYKQIRIITRVSGVKFSNQQNIEDMVSFWGNLVDQVAFVDYNPWENSYEKKDNNITESCSDLWRRMFIWWDGKTNPCDVDYKSNLSVGSFLEKSISELWTSESYQVLRQQHLSSKRQTIKPCSSCTVI